MTIKPIELAGREHLFIPSSNELSYVITLIIIFQ